MSLEEEKDTTSTKKVHYIVVSRKLLFTWLFSYVILIVLIVFSFQYTNYVSRQLCGLISISDDFYKKNLPPPESPRYPIAKEFNRVRTEYHCK